MSHSLPILKNIRIASPCDVPWASMQGDDRTRFCGACEKRVHNLVGMSEAEIAALFDAQGDDLCITLYQRHDGTLIAEDCPTGLRAARKRFRRAMSALGAAAAFLLTAGLVRGQFGSQRTGMRTMSPFAQAASWWSPAPIIRLRPKPPVRLTGRTRIVRPTIPTTTAQPGCGTSTADNGGAS